MRIFVSHNEKTFFTSEINIIQDTSEIIVAVFIKSS